LDEVRYASAEFTLRLCVGSDERLDSGEVVGHSLSIRRIVLGSPFIERGNQGSQRSQPSEMRVRDGEIKQLKRSADRAKVSTLSLDDCLVEIPQNER
jgi:hypothetical protein